MLHTTQGHESAYIIGLLIILSQLKQIKQQSATLTTPNQDLLKEVITQIDQVQDREPSVMEHEQSSQLQRHQIAREHIQTIQNSTI